MKKEDLDFIKAHSKTYPGVVLDLLEHISEQEREITILKANLVKPRETPDA